MISHFGYCSPSIIRVPDLNIIGALHQIVTFKLDSLHVSGLRKTVHEQAADRKEHVHHCRATGPGHPTLKTPYQDILILCRSIILLGDFFFYQGYVTIIYPISRFETTIGHQTDFQASNI